MAKNFQNNPLDVVDMPKFNDRQIYNNAISIPLETQPNVSGYAVPRQNVRRVNTKKRTKTSNIVGILFIIATVALLYVGNVIAVNNLAKEVNDLNAKHNQIISTNEVIKAEINRKASLERISLMAQEKLGMTNPKEAPVWFEVDPEKEIELQEKLK
ncbi:MAG: septum formation initiator family protein [Bacteroidota bacterium]|nr:septum formation initiator family protein [Bacteroidota bacterium]